jgi:hypothetical protein
MSLEALWAELESELRTLHKDEWVVRRLDPSGPQDFRLGINGNNLQRAFLIRVRNSAITGSVEFPRARGFELREEPLDDSPRTHTTLAICLTDARFTDMFTELVHDLYKRLTRITSHNDTVVEIVGRLKTWQSFMERAGLKGMGKELQRGLYGELVFLREYLIPQLGAQAAVESWVGPSGAQQDFQWARKACEVKTSVAKQHQKLWIASELQLDNRWVDYLWLFHLSLDSRQSSGETLCDAIDNISSQLAQYSIASELFARLLLEAGYHLSHRKRYQREGYSIREASFFLVTDGFPRIIEEALPQGVGDVRYSISVAECEHFKMSSANVIRLIGS